MNDEISIKLDNVTSAKIDEFEKREWSISDKEHYGKNNIDFTKRDYKFIARDKFGEILGTLKLTIEVNLAFVESLLVSSKYRRKGVGKKLIQTAEKYAKSQNCTKIYLETNEGWNAEKFYKKVGYNITGIHEKHILNQKTLIFTKFFN